MIESTFERSQYAVYCMCTQLSGAIASKQGLVDIDTLAKVFNKGYKKTTGLDHLLTIYRAADPKPDGDLVELTLAGDVDNNVAALDALANEFCAQDTIQLVVKIEVPYDFTEPYDYIWRKTKKQITKVGEEHFNYLNFSCGYNKDSRNFSIGYVLRGEKLKDIKTLNTMLRLVNNYMLHVTKEKPDKKA